MTRIKLNVIGAAAKAEVLGLLTDGMVGISVEITYDSVWEGLTKTLVCKSGDNIRSLLNVQSSAMVAHEVMIT